MVEHYNDEISEIYEAHIEERDSDETPIRQTVRKFSTVQWFVMCATVGLFYYLVYVKKTMLFWDAAIPAGLCILFIYLSAMQEEVGMKRVLTDKQIKAILQKELRWKQINTREIPDGAIWVGPFCKLRRYKGKVWKWDVGFEIHKVSGGVMFASAELEPYEGYIIAIKDRSEGYSGKESPDIEYVEPRGLKWDMKYGKRMGGGGSSYQGGGGEQQ
jgi:hypothetical protein